MEDSQTDEDKEGRIRGSNKLEYFELKGNTEFVQGLLRPTKGCCATFCQSFNNHFRCGSFTKIFEEEHLVDSTRICNATIQRGCLVKIAKLRILTSQLAFSIIVVTIPSVSHLNFPPEMFFFRILVV